MQYEHEAELAANIVIAAIQSGRIEVRAKDVATYYATIFEQIVCSEKIAQSTNEASFCSDNMPEMGV